MATEPTDVLAELMHTKRKVLEQLCATARRQSELINTGEMTGLIRLLSGKQKLVNALHAVERGLEPYRNENPESRVWASPAQRAACQQDAAECSRLLDGLLAKEHEQELQMVDRRDLVASQLRQVQSAHEAASAYKPHLGKRPVAAPMPDTPPTPGSLDLTTNG